MCVTLLLVRSECLGQFFHRLREGPHAAPVLLSWWPAVNEVREKEARGRHQTQEDEREQILSGDRQRKVKHGVPQGDPQGPDSRKKQHGDDPSHTTEVRARTTQQNDEGDTKRQGGTREGGFSEHGGDHCLSTGASKHLRGDFNYAWPTAEIAVMGAKGAVEILYRSELGEPEKIAARTAEYETRFANPFVAAEKGFIDEVIMPHSTRRRVSRAFASLRGKKLSNPWKKHDNIPL